MNTTRKRTTGAILGPVEKRKIVVDKGSNTEKWSAVKVSGTEVVKATEKVDVVWSVKGSTEKNGSQLAKSRYF